MCAEDRITRTSGCAAARREFFCCWKASRGIAWPAYSKSLNSDRSRAFLTFRSSLRPPRKHPQGSGAYTLCQKWPKMCRAWPCICSCWHANFKTVPCLAFLVPSLAAARPIMALILSRGCEQPKLRPSLALIRPFLAQVSAARCAAPSSLLRRCRTVGPTIAAEVRPLSRIQMDMIQGDEFFPISPIRF
jgi:hypothetical protein